MSLSLTNCIVELAESIWPTCSEATVGDSGVAAVEVVEPGELVYIGLNLIGLDKQDLIRELQCDSCNFITSKNLD